MKNSQKEFWDRKPIFGFAPIIVEPDPFDAVKAEASTKRILYLSGMSTSNFKSSMIKWRGGFDVHTPKLWDWFFVSDLSIAQKAYDEIKPDVIVGSSRGGALAMNIRSQNTPMILMAPAWKYFGNVNKVDKLTHVIHSTEDSLVPYEHSKELMKNSNGNVKLWKTTGSHGLGSSVIVDFLVEKLWQICGIEIPKIQKKSTPSQLADTVIMKPLNKPLK